MIKVSVVGAKGRMGSYVVEAEKDFPQSCSSSIPT